MLPFVLGVALVCCVVSYPAISESAPPSAPATSKATPLRWSQLTDLQRQTLAPLAPDWENLDAHAKRRWLEIARHYPTLKPEEQQRIQGRMREWAQMTPEQRRVARDSYERARALSPEKRAELLEKYQALPEAKKEQLAAKSKADKKLVPHKPRSEKIPTHAEIREGAKMGAPGAAAVKVPKAAMATVPLSPVPTGNLQNGDIGPPR